MGRGGGPGFVIFREESLLDSACIPMYLYEVR